MKKKMSHRILSLVLAVSMIITLFAAVPLTAYAKTGLATDIGWPTFINLDPSVLQPEVPLDPSTSIRQAIYDKDVTTGSGISFYIDRVLNRSGNTSGDGNTVLTRGRSIFSVQSSVPTGLGWSNNVVWLDTANSFNPLNVITFRGNGSSISYSGVTASRNNNPSYWSSDYATTNAAYSSVAITARKFISLNNVAVVILDITNNGVSEAENISFTVTAASCATPGTLPNGQPELTGVKAVRANLTTLYPRITADLDGEPCTLSGTTLTTPTIDIPAGGKAQLKVVTGITTRELPESTADYISYATDTADNAFKTQVRQYNKWYADTIPYIDVPNKAIQKAIEYRWWLTQYNTFDASLPGYDFQYPDTMEGVLGYNNNIVLTECMRLQDTKWMRSAYLPYGTLLNIGNSSMSSAFLDNPGKIANWNNHYGQYIGQAGLEAYKVHGGDRSIAEAFAYYFEHDAKGQLLHYGQHLPVTGRPTDAANNYGNAFLIAYRNAYMTGNDADTIDMAYPGAGTWKLRPESAYVYAAAKAAAELYDFVGDSAKALEMDTLAGNIQQDALNLLWSDKNKTFESYAVSPTGSFVVDDPAQPNLIPWKVNNHYNFFSTYLVPQDPASIAKYGEAFEFFKYADEYPMFPCFTANQADKALYGGGTNNFSNINFTLQARAYEAAIRTYDPTHQYVTPEMLSMLTAWQAFEVYPVSGGSADTRYPNNNEYFYNYNSTTKQYTRSGIYHDTLGNFNYIFIEDMAGIRPRMDDVIELDPISFSSVNNSLANAADFKYDHFMVNNINYHGSDLSIVWDDPSNPAPSYSAPQGYSLYINGERIFTVDHLAKILYDTQTGELTVDGHVVSAGDVLYLKSGSTSGFLEAPEVDVKNDINPRVSENFKKAGIDLELGLHNGTNLTQLPGTTATASYTATARAASWFEKHRADGTDPTSRAVNEEPPSPAAAIDGTTVGEPFWGTNGSANAKDWLQITFPSAQTFNNVKLFFYNDRDGFGNGTAGQGYAEPVRYSIQYLNGENWTTVTNNNKTPSIPSANFNDALFDTVTSSAIRIVVEKNGSHPVAIAEAQVFNSSLTAAPVVNQQPVVTARVGTTGNLSAQLIGTYADDGMPEDRDPSFRWTVQSAPAGALYQIADSDRMTASLVGDKAGDYSVKFTASDGEYSAEATVTVTLAKAASADVAPSAATSANYTASWETVTGPNNVSFEPTSSNPGTGKAWGNWSNGAPAWFQYTWSAPVYINSCDIYWYSDGSGTRVPSNWSIQYSDNGTTWTNVAVDASTPYSGATGTGKYNNLKFAPITTRYLRVNITAITGNAAGTGICRWKVYGPGIEKTADIYVMTPIGVQPALPSSQMVTYDTGVRISAPVTWSTIAPESLADENTFVVTGTVMGALTKANVYVRTDANLAQITDIWPMGISTAVGTAPIYPQYADVSYNNGGRTNTVVPVSWNAADQAAVDYATAGDYTVKGTVQKGGDTVETTLTVTVRYDSSIPLAITRIAPIAVSTPAKVAPALPAEVTAKYNDGNDRTVSVTWNGIDESQYATEGSVFTVEGTVSGTAVKATANVTVTAPSSDTTAPAEVTDIRVTAGDGQLTITWTDPADADFDHVLITTGSGIELATVGKGIRTVTITGLENDVEYSFTIATVDTTGNTSTGVTAVGTPSAEPLPDTTAPAEVTDIRVTAGDGQLTITWTDPADADFDHVLITTGSGIELAAVGKGIRTVTITGLENDVEYSFTIATVDTTGNTSTGVTAVGTPSAGPVEEPTIVSIDEINVTTTVGTAPELPGQVTAVYSDDSTALVEVVWNEVDEADYAQTGTFTVEGTVEGTLIKAIANVTVTEAGAVTHTITATAGAHGAISPAGAITVNDGDDLTFTITADSGYKINEVTVDGNKVQAAGSYTFENVTGDHTISVTFTEISSGGSGGGSTTSPSAGNPPAEKTRISNGNIDLTVPAVVQGVAQSTISSGTFARALDSASADETGVKTVTVKVPSASGANEYRQTFPTPVLSAGNANVNVVTDIAALKAPGNMFGNAGIQTETVSLSVARVDRGTLKPEIAEQIGNRPVIELSAYAGNNKITWNNSAAPVTVRLKYIPNNDEEILNREFVTVWYIDGAGNAVPVTNARYDVSAGEVTFTVTHFSKYAVAYTPKSFEDLAGYDWARHSIEVMAAKGAVYGVTADGFKPSASITRADFVKFLITTLELRADFTDNFTDVSRDSYYYDAAGIAKKLGISAGTGNGKFGPETAVSRQDLMVMTAKALKIAKGLDDGSVSDLAGFTDTDRIAGYARASIAAIVKAGIIHGSGGRINPLANTTRAEAAVIMYQLYRK